MSEEWSGFVPANRKVFLGRIGVIHYVGYAKSHVFRNPKKKPNPAHPPLMVYQILRLLFVVCGGEKGIALHGVAFSLRFIDSDSEVEEICEN